MACRYTTTRCAATTSGSSGGFTLPMGAALGLSPSASLVGARWWLVPRECTVCAHPESFAINEAIAEGKTSNRRIAAQYGLSEQAMRRHRQHIPELLIKASQAMEVADADFLIAKLRALEADAREALEANRGEDWRVFLAAISEIRENVKLLAQVSGKLQEIQLQMNTQVNIQHIEEHPDYQRLEDVLTRALEPYPAARYAVSDGLKEFE
jgi:hypothetical protein